MANTPSDEMTSSSQRGILAVYSCPGCTLMDGQYYDGKYDGRYRSWDGRKMEEALLFISRSTT